MPEKEHNGHKNNENTSNTGKTIITILLIVIFLMIVNLFLTQKKTENRITDIINCPEGGQMTGGAFPRSCVAPGGKTYAVESDLFMAQKETSCEKDEDCVLINKDKYFDCCFDGACGQVDYSKSNWIAVKSSWLDGAKKAFCEDKECSNAGRACSKTVVNDDFSAACDKGLCMKVSGRKDRIKVNPGCVDLCGDSACQDIVCTTDGCPCRETKESCPQDCTVQRPTSILLNGDKTISLKDEFIIGPTDQDKLGKAGRIKVRLDAITDNSIIVALLTEERESGQFLEIIPTRQIVFGFDDCIDAIPLVSGESYKYCFAFRKEGEKAFVDYSIQ